MKFSQNQQKVQKLINSLGKMTLKLNNFCNFNFLVSRFEWQIDIT